jgi:hypothetical protein
MDPREHERLFAERLPAGTPRPAAAALAAAFKPSLVAYGEAPALAAAVLKRPQLDAVSAELLSQIAAARPQLEKFCELRAAGATAPASPAVSARATAATAAPADSAPDATPGEPAPPSTDYLTPDAALALLGEYRDWGKRHALAARALLMPLRIALTGAEHGPELHFVLAALSGRQALERVQAALADGAGQSPERRDAT